MPPLVRRGTFWQRLKSRLDPKEVALAVAEELNDDKYYDLLNRAAVPIAVLFNILFVWLRNIDVGVDDDVFGDARSSHMYAMVHSSLLYSLAVMSCLNAAYAFVRKKQYQLLQQPIYQPPPTRSARLVRLDTGHGEEQVWQVDVWDPTELSLTLFTYFSPVHILLYYMVLPATRTHALLVGVLGIAMSAQFALIQARFVRQAQDTRVIHGQVLNEYDVKLVQPLMYRPVRDVGVQAAPQGRWTVDAYSPGVLLNRGTGHLNYTPTSCSSEHGTNTPRSRINGYTPSHTNPVSAISFMKQRTARMNGDVVTPGSRLSNSHSHSSPLLGSSRANDLEGDEIRVAWKPSPTSNLDKRKSFRPSR